MYLEEEHLNPTEILEAGGKIRHGIYADIPFRHYLDNPCDGPAISGSDIVHMEQECAAYAYAKWRCNPSRIPPEDTPSMLFGRAAHAFLLEGADAFRERFAVKPEGMSFATKDGKVWRADAEATGREVISYNDGERLQAMLTSIRKHETPRKLAAMRGLVEATAIAKDPETGLWLMARPDKLVGSFSCNLKTANAPNPTDFERAVFNYGYHLGDAFTRLVLSLATGEPQTSSFLVIGSDAPHLCYVATLKPEVAEYADKCVRNLIRQWAACVEADHWPSYTDKTIEIGLPAYAARKMQEAS